MKITITGASGFVGQNLSEYLKSRNNQLFKLSLRSPDWKRELNSKSDAIIHLAGKAHDTKNTSEASEYFQVNTELTKELFNLFLRSEIKDFFYFSSVKAVADTVQGVLSEDIVGNPITSYGQSKLKAEEYILSQKIPSDKRVFIIRPCMIHGPGNKGNLTLLYKLVKKGIPWPLAAFQNRRSFLAIDNLNYLIEAMLRSTSVNSGIYNFADDDSLSTNALITIIAEASSIKPKLWKLNKGFIEYMATLGDKLKLPLNNERLTKLTENFVVSNNKIKVALDIKKLPLTAAKGLEKTIKSFS